MAASGIIATGSWIMLALVHLPPAAVLVAPDLIQRLYGVETSGDLGMLLMHRGALFLAIVVLCIGAAIDRDVRRVGVVVVAISVLAFLVLFVLAGRPAGSLRLIAWVDLVALVPLAMAARDAWA